MESFILPLLAGLIGAKADCDVDSPLCFDPAFKGDTGARCEADPDLLSARLPGGKT